MLPHAQSDQKTIDILGQQNVCHLLPAILDTWLDVKQLSGLPLLLLWLFLGYLAYKADPAAREAVKSFVEGVSRYLISW